MIRYIKTFEVIFSRNNLSGMHISAMWHSWNVYNTFVRLVYIGFFLFRVLFSVVTIIGSVLGFIYKDSVRRVGLTLLIITNVFLLVFFISSFIILTVGFVVAGASASISVLFIPASLAPIVCVCQCGLLEYGACYVSFVLNSLS